MPSGTPGIRRVSREEQIVLRVSRFLKDCPPPPEVREHHSQAPQGLNPVLHRDQQPARRSRARGGRRTAVSHLVGKASGSHCIHYSETGPVRPRPGSELSEGTQDPESRAKSRRAPRRGWRWGNLGQICVIRGAAAKGRVEMERLKEGTRAANIGEMSTHLHFSCLQKTKYIKIF